MGISRNRKVIEGKVGALKIAFVMGECVWK